MARIFEPDQERTRRPDLIAMNCLRVHHLNDDYIRNKQGCEVNDGKFIKFIDDEEEL